MKYFATILNPMSKQLIREFLQREFDTPDATPNTTFLHLTEQELFDTYLNGETVIGVYLGETYWTKSRWLYHAYIYIRSPKKDGSGSCGVEIDQFAEIDALEKSVLDRLYNQTVPDVGRVWDIRSLDVSNYDHFQREIRVRITSSRD